MTFVSKDQDSSLIIKNYNNNCNNYEVEYLDGSFSQYYCSTEQTEKLRDKMIEQAKERQDKIDLSKEEIFRMISLGTSFICAFGVSVFHSTNQILLSAVSLAALFYSLYNNRKLKKRIQELKKYKLFLNLIDKLDEINTGEFLKCVEFDNIYQMPFDINYLDKYSYNSVKTIYKKINKHN